MVSIVQSYDGPLFIVVSAIGKLPTPWKNWTAYVQRDQEAIKESLNAIYTFHYDIIDSLDGYGRGQCLENFGHSFKQLEQYLTKEPSDDLAFEYDQIVSYGELFSQRLYGNFS